MLQIHGKNLSYKYPNQGSDTLKHIDFFIDGHSRVGLVGKNGSGKSTFLKLINGQLKPREGEFSRKQSLRIGYLSQIQNSDFLLKDFLRSYEPTYHEIWKRLFEKDTALFSWEDFENFEKVQGYEKDILLESYLTKFGLEAIDLGRTIGSLSGGEATKIGLLRILLEKPNFLLLDEPTNHLDQEGLDWLIQFLNDLTMPYILVSHERRLLDCSTTETWELVEGQLNRFGESFTIAMENKALLSRRAQELYKREQEKVSELKIQVEVRRQQALKMQNHKPSRSVKKKWRVV